MTGRRNRAHAPSRFLPPRPSPPFGFLYGLKKLDSENFKPQQTATKFSANIIWLLFYLFVGNPCLRVLYFEVAQAKEVGEAGERNPTFCGAKMSRFACLQAKLWLF